MRKNNNTQKASTSCVYLYLCVGLFMFTTTGCQALGLGNTSRLTSSITKTKRLAQNNKHKAHKSRESRRGKTSQTRTTARHRSSKKNSRRSRQSGNSSGARNVQAQMGSAFKRLSSKCPLNQGPLDKYDLRKCRYAHRNIGYKLKRINSQYHEEPLYVKVTSYHKEVQTKLPEWIKNGANNKARKRKSKRISRKFKKILYQHRWAIDVLWEVHKKVKIRLHSTYKIVENLKRIKKLKKIIKWCDTGEHKSMLPSSRFKGSNNPSTVCLLAQKRKPLSIEYVKSITVGRMKEKASWLQTRMERLKKKHVLKSAVLRYLSKPQEFVATQKKALSPVYKSLGVAMPEDSFSNFTSSTKGFRKLLRRSAQKSRFSKKARFSCKTCRNAFRNAGRKVGLTLVRYRMWSSRWKIVKSRSGIPLRRYRIGIAMLRKRGESYCRIFSMTATSQYRGGGRYTRATSSSYNLKRNEFTVSRCR